MVLYYIYYFLLLHYTILYYIITRYNNNSNNNNKYIYICTLYSNPKKIERRAEAWAPATRGGDRGDLGYISQMILQRNWHLRGPQDS